MKSLYILVTLCRLQREGEGSAETELYTTL